MKFNKTQLTLAVAGALASGAAGAVNLDNGTGVDVYASEIIIAPAPTGTVLQDGTATTLQATTSGIGFTFGAGSSAYLRFDLSNGATFDGTPTLVVTEQQAPAPAGVCATAGAPVTGIIAQGGAGSTFVVFAVTPTTANCQFQQLASDATLTAAAAPNGIKVFNSNTVNIKYGLYNLPENAANQTLPLRLVTQPYINFAPSYALAINNFFTNTADVNADPVFTNFVVPPAVNLTTAEIGEFGLALTAGPPAKVNGDYIALTDVLNFGSSKFIFAGDYSASALNGVFVDLAAENCNGATAITATDTSAEVTLAAVVTSPNPPVPFAGLALCYKVNDTTAIPVADYTVTLNAVANTGYTASGAGPLDLGKIVRNGTELEAPLAQNPAGWTGRLVLMNNSAIDRAYQVIAVAENDSSTGSVPNTPTLSSLANGTIAANSIKVLDLAQLVSGFASAPPNRFGLRAIISAPRNQVQGLIQLINNTAGAPTNYVMVEKGTN